MTTLLAAGNFPNMLDGLEEALCVLFAAPNLSGIHFWLHLIVGLAVLILTGKLFMRWIGNVEMRWAPLSFALIVPLLAWILAWAAADVWLVPLTDAAHPLLVKHAAALLLALVFSYFVILWSDAITRTHATIALALTYVCFIIGIFCADLAVGAVADGAQAVDDKVSAQIPND